MMPRMLILLALTACAAAAPAALKVEPPSKLICSQTAPPMVAATDPCRFKKDLTVAKFPPLDEKLLLEEDIEGIIEPGDSSLDVIRKLITPPRNGVAAQMKRWPGGYVYYEIADSTFTPAEVAMIHEAARQFEQADAVRLLNRTGQADYVRVVREKSSCSSIVGRAGGAQRLNLGAGCMRVGTVMHEFNHAIGFWHEQSRFDRDQHVEINKDNILEEAWHNFVIHGLNEATVSDTPYDLNSIMHYGRYAFAKQKNVWSIRPLPPNRYEDIGQRDGFSELDIQEMNALYPLCAVMWTQPQYEGESIRFVREFQTTLHSNWWNNLSSANVTEGCTLSVYSEAEFQGEVRDFTGKVPDLNGLLVENKAQSVNCRCTQTEPAPVQPSQ
ncbi:astacin-like metalloprotease toxin 1 [Paramacrobiotus metropolitanus]|uniref:astacin-like metalloprotease toxin 1 n=1 Tax=Paramacrobiotus metropolitanus TaxID=2943436 RepID=UPI00244586CD|nr:astacin-like metalloprotease toxin 1 [Paramacrobiotus metropolitanus]